MLFLHFFIKMRKELKSIAEIQMGYTFRSGLNPEPDGKISVIQMKDLTDDNIVDCSHLLRINFINIDEKHLVKKKDLIFRSRGQVNSPALVKQDLPYTMLAAPLFRIRITIGGILPEYLNWYLGIPESGQWFASRREGTYGGMISKKTLEQIEIEIPPLSRQKTILEMVMLTGREEKILSRLLELRKLYNAQLVLKAMKGE
jgi:restriction endonuclease S subunit